MERLLLVALLSLVSQHRGAVINPDSSIPIECLTATDLTGSWRMDHNGSNIRPGGPHSQNGYACDFYKDLDWFRFSGKAGNRMLNKCPPIWSCGTEVPFWTDEEVPKDVGVLATIKVYASYAPQAGSCKEYSKPLDVMRCSLDAPHDLIYRTASGPVLDDCSDAYCGMM